ncbi:MAG: hypothetical protein QM820_39970 [Minicystis sp.]
MGGAAQVDASRVVDVQECRAGSTSGCVPADNIQPGSPNPDHQTLRAYKKAGEVFIGAGIGASYSFIRGSGIALELKVMQLLPLLRHHALTVALVCLLRPLIIYPRR